MSEFHLHHALHTWLPAPTSCHIHHLLSPHLLMQSTHSSSTSPTQQRHSSQPIQFLLPLFTIQPPPPRPLQPNHAIPANLSNSFLLFSHSSHHTTTKSHGKPIDTKPIRHSPSMVTIIPPTLPLQTLPPQTEANTLHARPPHST